ncbi:MAG: FliA/WhiG family RNA polymerase sigma factor [Gracilibacteraceae bacterium]|jgi:RNA polymerase sigma factor for flagellar operon FliA|nr:FliA/WhiG family RNA polymerase sigma factor [Gracilibacteraceae bacterium]
MTNLWEAYNKTKSASIREELILKYTHLVKYVAGRLYASYGNNVEFDDLVSYGIFGLIDAIDKYDVGRGVKFETYAQLRIRGAIIDQLREIDWLPRSVRQKSRELEKAYSDLENKLGRPATDEEMAHSFGLSVEDFQKKIQNITTYSIISLDDLLEQKREIIGSEEYKQKDTPENIVESKEVKEILTDTISTLPEKEKKVVSLYYYNELTYKEIGKLLNISESRVSQLHTKAIIRMKNKLRVVFE